MLKEGSLIKIKASKALSNLNMENFVGLTGFISVDLTDPDRINKGYMVKLLPNELKETADDADDWFVPKESVKKYADED